MIIINAYAKINLTLEITGRRPDGFHLLETVMQQISLCDTVCAQKAPRGVRVLCSDPSLSGEKNIVWRAAQLFFEKMQIAGGVSVSIRKEIPAQAGLGGGSADAAAALLAFNELYDTNLSEEALCAIAAKLGADVPFCVTGGTKLGAGIGEILSPLPPLPPCGIVVAKPHFSVSTAQAYREIDRKPFAQAASAIKMQEALTGGSLKNIAEALYNDFELASEHPEIAQIKEEMRSFGALGAQMTGSGSAVYGLFEKDDPAAEACRAALAQKYGTAFLCEPMNNG